MPLWASALSSRRRYMIPTSTTVMMITAITHCTVELSREVPLPPESRVGVARPFGAVRAEPFDFVAIPHIQDGRDARVTISQLAAF